MCTYIILTQCIVLIRIVLMPSFLPIVVLLASHPVRHPPDCPSVTSPCRAQEIVTEVQLQISSGAEAVLAELRDRFLPMEILGALSIIDPKYWQGTPSDADFLLKVGTIKRTYGLEQESRDTVSGQSLGKVPPFLDVKKLSDQATTFAQAARSEVPILQDDDELAPATVLWRRLMRSAYYAPRISEFAKLAHLAMVMVPGSVEDERTFSTLKFIKNDQRNKLKGSHLSAAVRLKEQRLFRLSEFPYTDAIAAWRAAAMVRGRYF